MLDKTHDLVVGAFDRHTWNEILPWVNSLKRTGYSGKKAVILYNVDKSVGERLVNEGYVIFCFDRDDNGNFVFPMLKSVVVERFLHLYYFLSQVEEPIRYVITTDVKDVIFQRDPSEWLDDNLFKYDDKLVASGEGLTYENEPWSKINMLETFGSLVYDKVKDREIFCAGVIAGEYQSFIDLCLNVYLTCRGCPPQSRNGGGPDQAAYNIILSSEYVSYLTRFTHIYDNWAVNLGTTKYAIGNDLALNKENVKWLYDKQPQITEDGTVVNSYDEAYCIVHQYNRIPDGDKIRKLYE